MPQTQTVQCNANCQQPCNSAIWQPDARCFWHRVWKKRANGVFWIPPFASTPPPVWDDWIKRALRATRSAGPQSPPNGLGWTVHPNVKAAMSDRLFDFYRTHYIAGNPIVNADWQKLLDDLNTIAAAQVNLFWGNNVGAVVYGRSQKIASLIGKYLMSTLLISAGNLNPKQQYFMNTLIDSLPAVIDRRTIEHIGRLGHRIFHKNGSPKPWTTALGWTDFLDIQNTVDNLAKTRCCRSKAIYELCHIW